MAVISNNLLHISAASIKNNIYKNKFTLFFIILGLQLILNSYKIGDNSLWFDETFSVNSANRSISEVINISKTDPNPPLYPLFLHFWIKLFGISEFAVRFLSAFAGSLACSFLFLLALRFFNWQTAVFSMLMYFSSNIIFYYSQEARTYSFVLLFVVLSNYCYLRLTEEINVKKGIIYSVLLGLLNIGLFYLHMLSCFSIIAQVIAFPFFFLKIQKASNESSKLVLKLNFDFLKYYVLAGLVSIIVFLPWFSRFMFLVKEGGQNWWIQKPVFQDLKNCIYDFFITQELYQIYLYSMLGIICLLFFKKLRADKIRFNIILFAIISGPIALCLNYYIASYSPIFITRYVLFTVLGFMLLYTYILSLLNVNFGIKLLCLIAVAGYSFSIMDMPRKVKQDYKGAVAYLSQVSNEHTLITTDLPDVYAYYLDKNIFNEKDAIKKNQMLFKRGVFAQVYDVDWPNRLDFSKVKDIYYTQSFAYLNDPQNIVVRRLNKKFECNSKVTKYEGVFIWHYINKDYK